MKKYFIFLVIAISLLACEKTNTVQIQYYKMLGRVNVELTRIHESGRILGKFFLNDYLDNIKVELINNDKVVERTYTIDDTTYNGLYVFNKIELGKPYKIKIYLNDELIKYSKEFIVDYSMLVDYNKDSLLEIFPEGNPVWLENGEYFITALQTDSFDIVFNYESDNMKIFPMPAIDVGMLDLFISKDSIKTKLEIFDIKNVNIATIINKVLLAGRYSMQFGSELKDGLYIIKMSVNDTLVDKVLFLKGKKGCPDIP